MNDIGAARRRARARICETGEFVGRTARPSLVGKNVHTRVETLNRFPLPALARYTLR
ncbi:hypothetical protein BCAR13_1300019 [Paraburkholderia caribensis]|nr:hypothetical protein BCAR13_1300019 [Paraburkholderia caribensis]